MFRSKIATFSFVLASAVAVWGTTGCTSESTNKAPSEDSNLTGEDTPKKQSLTGSFVKHAAVGGESTGYALELPDAFNLVELDLATNGLEGSFAESARVRVQGYFTTVSGVEIPSRSVFVVEAVEAVDDQAQGEVLKLNGTLRAVAAIGGESTGYALELPDAFNLVELDLTTNGFDSKFTDGHPAYVEGTFKTVEGTEIPTRNVLVVKVLDLQYVAL